MNKSFITSLIIQKNNISLEDERKIAVKLLLKIPSINEQFAFCNVQAYAFGGIAQKIVTFCVEGEYLFLEGFILTPSRIDSEVIQDSASHLLFVITDMQPIF